MEKLSYTSKEIKEELIKAKKLYGILSKINHAIIRIKDPNLLYEEACRIVVEDGLSEVAWIATLDKETKEVDTIIQWGFEETEAREIESNFRRFPVKVYKFIYDAITTGKYSFWNHVQVTSKKFFWHDFYIDHNIKSLAAFPLIRNGEVFAVINLYFNEYDFLKEEDIELLTQLCEDITFAVDTIEKEISRKQMRKTSEENIRLLNEAREYDKLKTEFFANISHELRTPINVILSAIQLLNLYMSEDDFESDHEKLVKYIYTMQQNSYRLLRLVSNIIDITKIDAGFFELQLANNNIVNIIEDITLSVSEYTEQNGVQLTFDTEVEEKIMACDSDKIERIMLNLLSNSIKFTNEGGKIDVNIYDRQDKIIISVKDSGIGIPKEKLDVVFERFQQVDRSLRRSHEGSGIGLSIVKSLVELHGGTIRVESEYGNGTEFIVELPVRILEPSQLSQPAQIQGENIEKINIEFSDIYS